MVDCGKEKFLLSVKSSLKGAFIRSEAMSFIEADWAKEATKLTKSNSVIARATTQDQQTKQSSFFNREDNFACDCSEGNLVMTAFFFAVIPTAPSWDLQGKESSSCFFNKEDNFAWERPEESLVMTGFFTLTPKPQTSNSFELPSHFRYYASSIGRFLKPDNVIPNAYNPQSWNLYSYVNNNPVNFNDPLGHEGEGRSSFSYIMNPGSASWLNMGAYASFYSNLYGGNVALGGGGPGGHGGSSSSQTNTYEVGKWVLSGFFDMWISGPNETTVFSDYPRTIWTYKSYTVQGEIDLTPYKAELDRIDRAYNLWIKQHTGKFADFYHLGGPLSSMAWFLSLGSGGSCDQLAEEAAKFINDMNLGGTLIAEDVQSFKYINLWGNSYPYWAHATVEIKLEGQTVRAYDPYWRLFFENFFSK